MSTTDAKPEVIQLGTSRIHSQSSSQSTNEGSSPRSQIPGIPQTAPRSTAQTVKQVAAVTPENEVGTCDDETKSINESNEVSVCSKKTRPDCRQIGRGRQSSGEFHSLKVGYEMVQVQGYYNQKLLESF